jgi:hypothetical protein
VRRELGLVLVDETAEVDDPRGAAVAGRLGEVRAASCSSAASEPPAESACTRK